VLTHLCVRVERAGYGFTDGHKTTPEQLSAIFNGLTVNGLLGHGRILTGYIPGAEALKVVADQITQMKQHRPDIIYVLDRESAKRPPPR